MHVRVNGVRLYFDVEGAGLVPDGPGMREKPTLLGVSFGGMVALAYATRHPEHPGKLVLVSTEAAGGSYRARRVELFERLGGPDVGALARRRFAQVPSAFIASAVSTVWARYSTLTGFTR